MSKRTGVGWRCRKNARPLALARQGPRGMRTSKNGLVLVPLAALAITIATTTTTSATPTAVSTISAAATATTTTTTAVTTAAPATTTTAAWCATTAAWCATTTCATVEGHDVLSLRTLLALAHFEFDLLAFFQLAEPAALNGREVDEAVLAAVVGCDETVTLLCIEPLYYPCGAWHRAVFLSLAVERGSAECGSRWYCSCVGGELVRTGCTGATDFRNDSGPTCDRSCRRSCVRVMRGAPGPTRSF